MPSRISWLRIVFVRAEREETIMSDDKERTEIYVNEDRHEINTKKITYERVVELYLGEGGKTSPEYPVKYSHGPVENPKGTLVPGQEVKVKDDMRFRVTGAGES